MPSFRLCAALVQLALVAALLAACGAAGTAGGPPPSAAPTAAPAATGGPGGGSDLVPTPSPLSEADLAATATAQAGATPTPFSQADLETATARAGGSGEPPPVVTRTPLVGLPAVLPAPIYLLSAEPAAVLRVERDLANYNQVTFEQQPVLELAVPARGGGIFYIVGDPAGGERTLVALSGAGRRPLLYGQIASLAVSPDGQRVFFRLDSPEPGLIIGQDESPAGVWVTTPDGGRPGLVIADDPTDGAVDDTPAWRYSPIAVSPDGSRLALYAYDMDGPAIPGGELVILDERGEGEPVRGPTCCELPVWSADGTALHVAGGAPGPDLRYGLYWSDAATGVETPMLAQGGEDPSVPLVTAPRRLADGQTYAFVELASAEGFSWEYPFRPALSVVAPDGTVTPLSPPVLAPGEVLWAEDGAGAVIAAPAPQYGRLDQLFWLPADGRAPELIPFAGGDLAWVPAEQPLAAGDCAAFIPLAAGAAGEPAPEVFDLQGRLLALSFDPGQIDGLFGERTRGAIMAFQQAHSLPATGEVNCATWQALLAQR